MTSATDTWGMHKEHFWLHGMRPGKHVRYDRALGLWNIYGYPEAVAVISDPKTFSSNTLRLASLSKEFVEGSLAQMDPPDHNKLRKLVSHAFTAKVVTDLTPRITELTCELLDQVADSDGIELVADLAYPLPVTVIAELLGVPAADRPLFKQWVDLLFERNQQFFLVKSAQEQEQRMADDIARLKPLRDYLAEHVADRRRKPRDDLLTRLVQAEVDNERLTSAEIITFARFLLIAGHVTTTMVLGNTLLCLDSNPVEFARVRADRSLLPGAIEESLRFFTPIAAQGRVANQVTELGGQTIEADQILVVWLAAANRDARQFPNPNVFDPARNPNQHIAFGRGIHFCLGAPLARLEGRIVLDILLNRFPSLRTDPSQPPTFMPMPTLTGVRTLPMLTS
jgi:cytochrome P450